MSEAEITQVQFLNLVHPVFESPSSALLARKSSLFAEREQQIALILAKLLSLSAETDSYFETQKMSLTAKIVSDHKRLAAEGSRIQSNRQYFSREAAHLKTEKTQIEAGIKLETEEYEEVGRFTVLTPRINFLSRSSFRSRFQSLLLRMTKNHGSRRGSWSSCVVMMDSGFCGGLV